MSQQTEVAKSVVISCIELFTSFRVSSDTEFLCFARSYAMLLDSFIVDLIRFGVIPTGAMCDKNLYFFITLEANNFDTTCFSFDVFKVCDLLFMVATSVLWNSNVLFTFVDTLSCGALILFLFWVLNSPGLYSLHCEVQLSSASDTASYIARRGASFPRALPLRQ